MAEINMASNSGGAGVRRSKKLSTRVDLTPMVDLGFLLITFFIFTTSMSEPKATNLKMPADVKDKQKDMNIAGSNSLTIILLDKSKVFYYHGSFEDAVKANSFGTTTFDFTTGIGQVIRQKQLNLDQMKPDGRKDLFITIKPLDEAAYGNVVASLDEMLINAVPSYAIVDIEPAEKEIVKELITPSAPRNP